MPSDVVVAFRPPAGHPREVTRIELAEMPVQEDLGDRYTASIDLSSESDRETLTQEVFKGEKKPDLVRYLEGIPCLEIWFEGSLVSLLSLSGTMTNDDGYGLADRSRVTGLMSLAGMIALADDDAARVVDKTAQAIEGLVSAGVDRLSAESQNGLNAINLMAFVRVGSPLDGALYHELKRSARRLSQAQKCKGLCEFNFKVASRKLL